MTFAIPYRKNGFSMARKSQLETIPFAFGSGFLEDHAGHIMRDSKTALIELIANSYDAGATQVDVTWPDAVGGGFSIEDNGSGMTPDEFAQRWKTLGYRRLDHQGTNVTFPPGTKARPRTAFGQSGKGRHGAFCFADTYEIETWRDGTCLQAEVSVATGGAEPFHCREVSRTSKEGNGTRIKAVVMRGYVSGNELAETIGSKFAVDPEFQIRLNGTSLILKSLKALQEITLTVPDYGPVQIYFVEAPQYDRTVKLRGITWWVQKRMVGEPSWAGLDREGAILDGRTKAAKQYSFVVEADMLKPDVKPDWSGFHDSPRFLAVKNAVRAYAISKIDDLLSQTRKERKVDILKEHRETLKQLAPVSQKIVGEFIDEVNKNCPSISDNDLSRTVEVLTKLEQSRDGYDLLGKLAACTPDDLDRWNRLMQEWTSRNAEIVLTELGRRLKLITQLEEIVDKATTDELHELQPLFGQGLWMFGPEFEAADFSSNRTMATVIRTKFGGSDSDPSNKRPDIVALPDTSLGFYSADAFNDQNEVDGFRSVIIVELKRGGFEITTKEMRQAEDYANELMSSNLVKETTKLHAYVLGSKLADAKERTIGGNICIQPMPYAVLLRRAHARTFHLKRKLETEKPVQPDAELKEAMDTLVQGELSPTPKESNAKN
jgi:hypothetical protein